MFQACSTGTKLSGPREVGGARGRLACGSRKDHAMGEGGEDFGVVGGDVTLVSVS